MKDPTQGEELDASAVIAALVEAHPDIASVSLFESPPAPDIWDRLSPSEEDTVLIDQSLRSREGLKVPFWDSLFLIASREPLKVSAELWRAAGYHQSGSDSARRIRRADLSARLLREWAGHSRSGRVLVMSSAVELTDGSHRQIPMLDFSQVPTGASLRLVREMLAQMHMSGQILVSGRSFHFYGDALLTDSELRVFLGRSLLYGPLVDRRWVAHQLIEGACGLRISSGPNGLPIPRVVSSID
jgi:hypothetical protein